MMINEQPNKLESGLLLFIRAYMMMGLVHLKVNGDLKDSTIILRIQDSGNLFLSKNNDE